MTSTVSVLVAIVAAASMSQQLARPEEAPFNRLVLHTVNSIEDGGGYKWADTGAPWDITFQGEVILRKSAEGTYCNGVSFAVVMKVAADQGLLETASVPDVREFQRNWYGTTDESSERQCVLAMKTLKIGWAVELDDAQPGDFVQFWRETTGHNAVFLGWVRNDEGARVGLQYRSSQESTDGIGTAVERFAGHGGSVNPHRVYLGRLGVKH